MSKLTRPKPPVEDSEENLDGTLVDEEDSDDGEEEAGEESGNEADAVDDSDADDEEEGTSMRPVLIGDDEAEGTSNSIPNTQRQPEPIKRRREIGDTGETESEPRRRMAIHPSARPPPPRDRDPPLPDDASDSSRGWWEWTIGYNDSEDEEEEQRAEPEPEPEPGARAEEDADESNCPGCNNGPHRAGWVRCALCPRCFRTDKGLRIHRGLVHPDAPKLPRPSR